MAVARGWDFPPPLHPPRQGFKYYWKTSMSVLKTRGEAESFYTGWYTAARFFERLEKVWFIYQLIPALLSSFEVILV